MGDEASCAYNQCFVLRLRGPLSMESMRNARSQQVVERHDALTPAHRRRRERQEILDSIALALAVTI